MKKDILALIGAVLLLLVSLFAFRGVIFEKYLEEITGKMFVAADRDDFDPGLPTGTLFPPIRASYRGREISDVSEFLGDRGMIFLANRSVDWCPYCMRQVIELQALLPGFRAAGIGVVAMTYDAPELQRDFIERYDIDIPLLSDIDTSSVKTLGILNTKYQPGDHQYGIPYPGIYLLDTDMRIVAKLFVEDYAQRVEAGAVLNQAIELLKKSG